MLRISSTQWRRLVPQSTSGGIGALLGGVSLAGLCLVVFLLWSGYNEAIRGAEITTRNYAAILETRLDATLRVADQSTRRVAETMPVSALWMDYLRRFDEKLNADLASRIAGFPELASLRVFNAAGDLMYANDAKTVARFNIADRALFRHDRDATGDKPFFSEVIDPRSGGDRIIVVSRPVRDDAGRFQGVVGASLNLRFFEKLFQQANLGAGSVIAIYRSDDFRQVLRAPPGNNRPNTPLPADSPTRKALPPGTDEATIQLGSAADGQVRIYSYKKLRNYPFFISVGISHDDILAQWRLRSIVVAVLLLLLAGMFAALLFAMRRAERALVEFNASLEQRVDERTSKLEQVNAELEAFMYSVSHDLRAPLRAIDSNSAILEDELALPAGGDASRRFGRIRTNVRRMTQLLGEMLDLSRASTRELRTEDVDMQAKVESVIGELEDLAHGVRFEVGDLPACRGDRGQLRQVWSNLIGNAIKYSAKNENPLVRIGFEHGAYYVADNGVGFDMAFAGKLFKLFSRLHHDNDFEGTGAGLAIVKRIIERHHGKISADAVPGKGARFCFTILG